MNSRVRMIPHVQPPRRQEAEERRRGQHLVGQRIEKFAKVGDKAPAAGDFPVEHIGQRRRAEHQPGRQIVKRKLPQQQQ